MYSKYILCQKKAITDIHGNTKEIDCLSCAIVSREVEPPGALPVSKYFDAHQDYEVPIPGFIILASKRHIQSVEEFTEEEQADFIQYLKKIRSAMNTELYIKKVILVQDEKTRHHFHMWIFPRYEWMEQFGEKIESVRPSMQYAREHLKTEENLKSVEEAAQKLREVLS